MLVSAAWVGHVYRAWQWWIKGSLELVEPTPSGALMEAIDTLQRESNSRERKQADDDKRDAEAARQKPQTAKKKSTGY